MKNNGEEEGNHIFALVRLRRIKQGEVEPLRGTVAYVLGRPEATLRSY